jgi:hypothetical protein
VHVQTPSATSPAIRSVTSATTHWLRTFTAQTGQRQCEVGALSQSTIISYCSAGVIRTSTTRGVPSSRV